MKTNTKLNHLIRIAWGYLRELSGENDYERYRARTRALGLELLTPAAFYLSRLREKYLRPNRCC